ncbi:uncharacterized protein LOC106161036 [Lingula anatina]|uniref:Uncharacterized protein LOC106161036 n=1 Tax=Lingula anatina TaxID=7574 RepID=A0A1S3I525_LINAN|nr:uncharacterized protein LOC106161036 [Lingula anatina]|eukprot:XP_013393323.1 uncharacterized protein LOC106161036 [Lingula anatina]
MDGHSLKLKFKPIRTRDEGTHESCTGQVLSEDAEEDKAVSECPSTRTALYSSTDYQWHSPFTQPLEPQTFQTHSLMDNMCKADTGDIEGSEEYFRDVMGGTLGTQDQPYNRLPPVQVFGCSVPRVYSFQQLYGYRDWETSTPMWMTQGTRDSRSYGSTDYSSMTSAVQPLQPDDHSSTLRTDHSSTLRTDHTFNHSGSLRWTLLQNENGTNTISSIPSYPTSQIPVYKPPGKL